MNNTDFTNGFICGLAIKSLPGSEKTNYFAIGTRMILSQEKLDGNISIITALQGESYGKNNWHDYFTAR